jgi:hypothetical protein
MSTELVLRFDYGAVVPWITRLDDCSLQAIAGPDMVILYAEAPFAADGFRHRGEFTVAAEEQVAFSLRYGPSYLPVPPAIDAREALEATQAAWEEWSSTCKQRGDCSKDILRSAITLKALTYRPTGGIVAAPTTSLPEALGGVRNWDYRFCWLRDATFTLMALMNAGFHQEAAAWRAWLRRAVAGDPAQVQIMYGLAGERRLDEWLLPWLPGYEGSNPVRIGNAAAGAARRCRSYASAGERFRPRSCGTLPLPRNLPLVPGERCSMEAIGRRRWAIAEGYIPSESAFSDRALISHETACILNAGDREARIEITIVFADREPVGPYKVTVGARRTLHLRFNDLKDPKPVPRDTDYASIFESDVPIIVQHTRLDSRRAELALLSTMAYSES